MLEVSFPDGLVLRKMLDNIKDLNERIMLDCTETGMTLREMDASRCALTCWDLRAEAFEDYRCDAPVKLGLRTADAAQVLRMCEAGEALRIVHAPGSGVVVFHHSRGPREDRMELRLAEAEDRGLELPEAEYTASATMSASMLAKHLKLVCGLGSTIAVALDRDRMELTACKSDALMDARLTVPAGTVPRDPTKAEPLEDSDDEMASARPRPGAPRAGLALAAARPVRMAFASNKLLAFMRMASLADEVSLQLDEEQPLLLRFPLACGLGTVRFYLAASNEDQDEAEAPAEAGETTA